MKKTRKIILLIGYTVLCQSFVWAAPPANYEGFGAVTRGALDAPGGYETYHVTKLADDGSEGTLRHAITGYEAGSRLVVFDVGGTINATGSLRIHSSYITIDGNTAPSPGITLDMGDYVFEIEGSSWLGSAHDIIINNLRLIGPGKTGSADLLSLTAWTSPIYNVIVDHCTITDIGDGCDIVGDVTNVTFSWNLIKDTDIAQLLNSGHIDYEPTCRESISIHHNVYAKNAERQLRLSYDSDLLDFVNNVVYGWDFLGGMRIAYTEGGPNPNFNMENNYYYMWENGFYDNPDHALVFDGGKDLSCNYYFNGNIFPEGETDDITTGSRLPIPAWAEVTKYDASSLGDSVVPYVGTHYPTAEEQALLNEISLAIGGQGLGVQSSWQPPIGIPRPEFGIEETYRMYDNPANRNPALTYTQNAEGGYYTHYVDNTHASATNTSNPYGSKDIPRLTIPATHANPLPAGSVVEVHGGPYSYSSRHDIEAHGTSSMPVFIRGNASKPEFRREIVLIGEYIILENFSTYNATISIRIPTGYPYSGIRHHISIRNCELEGDGTRSGGAGVHAYSYTEQIVIYNNHIHHGGDYASLDENDVCGTTAGAYCHYIWIVDNHIHHMGGDSFQTGHGAEQTSSHIYVGRNKMHDDGENAVDLKDVTDVIVSQNTMYNYPVLNGSSDGAITVTHYGPSSDGHRGTLRAWFICNEMFNAGDSANRASGEAKDIYFIGNIIHDVNRYGLNSWNQGDIYFINNTLSNVSGGVRSSAGEAYKAAIINNIFGKLIQPTGIHIDLEYSSYSRNSTVSNNLFHDPMNVKATSLNAIESDPLFNNPANNDFQLQETSPAIDKGMSSGIVQEVFDRFQQLYGVDIRRDFNYGARPYGSEWDIGAYEWGSTPAEPPKPPEPPQPPEPEPEPEPEAEPEVLIPDVTALLVMNNVIKSGGNQSAVIKCDMKEPAYLIVIIYDAKGKEIRTLCNEYKDAGVYTFNWSGKDSADSTVGSGIYIVHMKSGGYSKTAKIAIVK